MICQLCDCDAKMKCTFSVPLGKTARLRYYRCPECGDHVDTVEVRGAFWEAQQLDLIAWKEITREVREAKRRQMAVLNNVRMAKKKGVASLSHSPSPS